MPQVKGIGWLVGWLVGEVYILDYLFTDNKRWWDVCNVEEGS